MKRLLSGGAALLAALAMVGCSHHACDVCDDCGDGTGAGCGACNTRGAYAKTGAGTQKAPGYVVPGTQAVAQQPAPAVR